MLPPVLVLGFRAMGQNPRDSDAPPNTLSFGPLGGVRFNQRLWHLLM